MDVLAYTKSPNLQNFQSERSGFGFFPLTYSGQNIILHLFKHEFYIFSFHTKFNLIVNI